jgi:multiple sugar transport system substrate-binding protein
MTDPQVPGQPGGVSRRSLFRFGALAAGAAVVPTALAACGSDGSSTAGATKVGKGTKADLVMTTWNIPADLVTYKKFAQAYQQAHPGVNIKVQVTPNGDFNQYMSTQLAGGNAPDIIRLTWQQIGRWAGNGGLIPLDSYLAKGYGDGIGETFWKAAQLGGKVHGIPQHTDTFATFYRKDIFSQIGATPPASLDATWNWSQFLDLARQVKGATGKAALVYGFEGVNTAYRWLPFLYMHGGKLLEDDLKTPAIDSTEGVDALAWFQNLYKEGLIPKSNTVKGSLSSSVIQAFTSGTAGLMIFGDWLMGDVGKGLPQDKWDVTYMPKDASAASDLGGNLLAVSKTSKNPAVAADFIQFVCNEANMKYFCENDSFLPVRTSLISSQLQFANNGPQMQTFTKQASTVPAAMAAVETSKDFAAINQVLADQLDLCFLGQQTAKETASKIASGIKSAVA